MLVVCTSSLFSWERAYEFLMMEFVVLLWLKVVFCSVFHVSKTYIFIFMLL
jgi:hypothetical protein